LRRTVYKLVPDSDEGVDYEGREYNRYLQKVRGRTLPFHKSFDSAPRLLVGIKQFASFLQFVLNSSRDSSPNPPVHLVTILPFSTPKNSRSQTFSTIPGLSFVPNQSSWQHPAHNLGRLSSLPGPLYPCALPILCYRGYGSRPSGRIARALRKTTAQTCFPNLPSLLLFPVEGHRSPHPFFHHFLILSLS
jgi:hypothetical protein